MTRLDEKIVGWIDALPHPLLRIVARAAARTRPIGIEPGWYFDKSEEDQRLATHIRRTIWRRYAREQLDGAVTVGWYGSRLRLHLGNDLSKTIYVGGSFEPNEFAFLDAVLRPGMTFVDGGANEGVYSVFAGARVGPTGRVVAFEPSTRERGRLVENIRLNKLENVTVRPVALGADAGEATLAVAGYGHEGQNTMGSIVSNPNVETTGTVSVPVAALDDFDLPRVDVIKLDIEGSEVSALKGAAGVLERDRPLLQLEVDARALAAQASSRHELVDLLTSFGYETYVFDSTTAELARCDDPDELSGNIVAAPEGWRPPALAHGHTTAERAPYLSVVATARNDNHGGDLLHRMQVFVNGLAAQAERFHCPVELVLVEWNPPADRPPLAEALEWPAPSPCFHPRIVTVPMDLHRKLTHSDRLPLFQMIAKNVGIRRARGRFVLATNVDVLISDDVMSVIAARALKSGRFYRVDRTDVDADLDPFAPIEEQLAACEESVLRICSLEGTYDRRSGTFYAIYGPMTDWPGPFSRWGRLVRYGFPFVVSTTRHGASLATRAAVRRARARLQVNRPSVTVTLAPLWKPPTVRRALLLLDPDARAKFGSDLRSIVRLEWHPAAVSVPDHGPAWASVRERLAVGWAYARARRAEVNAAWESEKARVRLHTNACGDFTLLAREDWARLRGYAELEMFSMHLDSLLLYEAHYIGLKQIVLDGSVYHLEHESGFRPDDDAVRNLNARLERAAIPQITNEQFLEHIMDMYRRRAPLALNDEQWGLGDATLPEHQPVNRAELAS